MLEAILRILALTRKELLAILKDPREPLQPADPADSPVPYLRLCRDLRFELTFLMRCSIKIAALHRKICWPDLDGSGVFRRVANLEPRSHIRKTDP